MKNNPNYKKLAKIIALYGPQIWIILFFANISVITITRIFAASQSCLTIEEVNNDSRCLYIKSNEIYEMGSRNSPHHGHPCGMDVTSIIPSSHTGSADSYLVPNYVGPVCSATQTPVPTQAPTAQPKTTLTGDVNIDGVVNIVDIGIIIDNYNSSTTNQNSDINKDGVVNIVDIGLVIDNYTR